MPTVLRAGPYRLFFYSQDCAEPAHVHVQRERFKAKVWLDPIEIGERGGFASRELRDIERLVEAHQDELIRKWEIFCAQAE